MSSAGLETGDVHPEASATMNEVGVDISRQTAKALSNFNPENFDVVVALCSGDELPSTWTKRERFEDWQIDDPTVPARAFSGVRDETKLRVVRLIDSINLKRVTQG